MSQISTKGIIYILVISFVIGFVAHKALIYTSTSKVVMPPEVEERVPSDNRADAGWKFATFLEGYPHEVAVKIKNDWGFDCCTDVNLGREHVIYPAGLGVRQDQTKIVITEHELRGCQEGVSCAVDRVVPLTPAEKVSRREAVLVGQGYAQSSQTYLAGLNTTAKIYTGGTLSGAPRTIYLIEQTNSMLEVGIYEPETVNPIPVDDVTGFLQRLQ